MWASAFPPFAALAADSVDLKVVTVDRKAGLGRETFLQLVEVTVAVEAHHPPADAADERMAVADGRCTVA
jgi:hypothetical protein